jgi:hypothetical protein
MSITIAFGRWGLPYLVSIGRWEWTCYRTADDAAHAPRRWGIARSPGSEQQLRETIVYCGRIAHCFTLWPRRTPLPPAGWAGNRVRTLASNPSAKTPSSARGV